MDLYAIRESFGKAGIMICFNGPFSHSIIEEIGLAVRNHLSAQDMTKAAVLDVFAVFIELAQNVKNYATVRDITDEDAKSSIITIARKDGVYAVSSGNVVYKDDIPKLTAYIDTINSLDRGGLRKLYKEQIRKEHAPSDLGAGLGIMEVAKRATAPISYSVSGMDEKLAFFCLTAYV